MTQCVQSWKMKTATKKRNLAAERIMNTGKERLLRAVGLCKKAGALIMGTDMICAEMKRSGGALPKIVAESSDCSENTHKRLHDKCIYYKVRHITLDVTREELGQVLGGRTAVAAVGITDENLCKLLEKSIDKTE